MDCCPHCDSCYSWSCNKCKMKTYGFIKGNIIEEDYIFGGSQVEREVLQANGQWFDFLPEYEPQSTDEFETDGCTIYGTENAIEMIMKRKFGINANYSERYIYNLIPIRPPGGSPQVVAEIIRKGGLIEQADLPMVDTFEQYCTPEPMSEKLIKSGQEWLKKYELKHDYLWKTDITIAEQHKILKDALQYSPVGISVSAWNLGPDDTYVDNGEPNNHWCVCFGYEVKDKRFYPLVFDSYDHSIKTLDPNHHIEIAKSYYITPVTTKKKGSLISRLLAWFKGL